MIVFHVKPSRSVPPGITSPPPMLTRTQACWKYITVIMRDGLAISTPCRTDQMVVSAPRFHSRSLQPKTETGSLTPAVHEPCDRPSHRLPDSACAACMGGSYQRRHSIDGDEDSGAVDFNWSVTSSPPAHALFAICRTGRPFKRPVTSAKAIHSGRFSSRWLNVVMRYAAHEVIFNITHR